MVLHGEHDDGLWWIEAEDDDELEILDDNDHCENAIVDKASPRKIHDWQSNGKRKFVVKPKVPAKKLCPANKKPCQVHMKVDLVEKSSSIITTYEVDSLFLTANISPTDYEVLIPSTDQRANKPPEGYMTVYRKQIEWGLRFPLHALVIEICNVMNVSPSQLTPNAHSLIVGFLLCTKFYKIPATARLFFSLFRVYSAPSVGFFFFQQHQRAYFLDSTTNMTPPRASWKTKFFFIKPTRLSWKRLTKWNATHSSPKFDAYLADSAMNLGMMEHYFQLCELMQKKFLVHGGIEPGNAASEQKFRSLMTRAAKTKSKQLPEAKSIACATTQGPEIHSKGSRSEPAQSSTINPATIADTLNATGPASKLVLSTVRTACPVTLSAAQTLNPSPIDVPILEDFPASSKDSIPLNVLFPKEKENQTAKSLEPDHVNTSSSMTVADDCARSHALPPPLLAMSQILESMYVKKECYQKLQMDMQELTSELADTKSRIEELLQELELSEAKRVYSENRTSWAMEDVKRLEKTVKNLRSDSAGYHDKLTNDAISRSSPEFVDNIEKIRKDTIDAFKSSQEFLGRLDQIRRDAIEKFKLSEEFLDWNEMTRKHAIKTFKYSDEFLERCGKIRKDAIEGYKSSDEFLQSLNQIREVAVESFKSSNEFMDFRDNTRKEVIEEFRCSDEFLEETVKYYVNGFETCQLQFMNCGHLSNGFNLDFLDVGADAWGKLTGQMHDGTMAGLNMNSIKLER